MIIYISNTFGGIISLFLIPILLLAGYLLYKWLVSSFKQSSEDSMLSLNLVIKYNVFLKYLKYKKDINEDYCLYMVSINNFYDLSKKYNEKIVRAYVRKTVKNLSMILPYGGKLAQTPKRDTFILYVPNIYGNEEEYALMFKESVLDPLIVNSKTILEGVSIGYISGSDKDVTEEIKELNQALIASKRDLNTITKYQTSITFAEEDYIYVNDKINKDEIIIKVYDVIRDRNNRNESYYFDFDVNKLSFDNYILQIPQTDRLWANMSLISKLLNVSEKYVMEKEIFIPVLISLLESISFSEYIDVLFTYRNIDFSKVVFVLYPTIIYKEETVLENILRLKDKGVKFAYYLEGNNEHYRLFVDKFHVDKVLFDFNRQEFNKQLVEEIINYGQVNQIETVVNGLNGLDISFYTHYLNELDVIKINEKTVKVKKAKKKKVSK